MTRGTADTVPGTRADDSGFEDICRLNWRGLNGHELIDVAWAYYYFSVQFRENVQIARALYPDDERLRELAEGECDTDNLSPWPGVAAAGERMNHDEFMRRSLALSAVDDARRQRLESVGHRYLGRVRALDSKSRALSLASYENGGLVAVFRAMLKAPVWDNPVLEAFRHFLNEHIGLDADPENGHGALCRHLVPDAQVNFLWQAFREALIEAAPRLVV